MEDEETAGLLGPPPAARKPCFSVRCEIISPRVPH